jgi:hypothetical protein
MVFAMMTLMTMLKQDVRGVVVADACGAYITIRCSDPTVANAIDFR